MTTGTGLACQVELKWSVLNRVKYLPLRRPETHCRYCSWTYRHRRTKMDGFSMSPSSSQAKYMTHNFELDTLKIRLADSKLASLDLRVRVQRVLRQLIFEGVLAPGCRLPATRTLSRSLGMSRDTAEIAYVQLQLDGYLCRREGSGSFVSEKIGPSLRGVRRRKSTPVSVCVPSASSGSRLRPYSWSCRGPLSPRWRAWRFMC